MIKTSECSSQSGSRSCVPSHFLLRHFLNQQADALEHWVLDRLPETTPPAMLGLPPHADRLLQRARCRDTLRAVSALFARDGPGEKEEEADDESGGAGGEATSVVRSSQMSRAGVLCCAWLEQVPTELAAAAASGSTDALPRFWRRERQLAAALLCDVRGQLSGLAKAAERHSSSQQPAARVARTRARILASCAVALHAGSSLLLAHRCPRWLQILLAEGRRSVLCLLVWIGGLLGPAALLTAPRQHACAANGWPLEKVALRASFAKQQASPSTDWVLTGLSLHGAGVDAQNLLCAASETSAELPPLVLSWQLSSSDDDMKTHRRFC